MALATAPKKQLQELRLEELDVFTLPEREALTSCGGAFLSLDINVKVDVNFGHSCYNPCNNPCG